jgi:rare lipoprotein A
MRRSLRLLAAVWWLLQLGACGDQPPAKSPHRARAPHRAAASYAHSGEPNGAESRFTSSAEPSENPGETPRHGRDAEARRDLGATTEQLAARFSKARALAVQSGSGSYYSDAFAGRATASGVAYEPRGFTAAHRNLPFGTVLRVTRLDGGQNVYVRVTDRGPYGPRGRILDLSRAAAERLGMLRAGVAKIRLEVVEYGPKKPRRRGH